MNHPKHPQTILTPQKKNQNLRSHPHTPGPFLFFGEVWGIFPGALWEISPPPAPSLMPQHGFLPARHPQRESPTWNESGASVAAQLERLWPQIIHTHRYIFNQIHITILYMWCMYIWLYIYKVDTVYDALYLFFYHKSSMYLICISYMIHIIRTWTILDGYNDDSKRFKCIDSYMISHIHTAECQQETLISNVQPFASVRLVIGHDTKSDAINLLQTSRGVLGKMLALSPRYPCC